MRANSAGAAPWKEKIDCFSSPTAKIVAPSAAARALTGGELGCQKLDDLPLLGAGVLRLVDEDVVDAAVELVEHPFGAGPAQKVERPADEIVEVERGAARASCAS